MNAIMSKQRPSELSPTPLLEMPEIIPIPEWNVLNGKLD